MPHRHTTLPHIRTYFVALWHEAGPQLVATSVLSAVAALMEGTLLLLLAPLLSLTGLTGTVEMTGRLMRTLQAVGMQDLVHEIGQTGLIGLWIVAAVVLTVMSAFREIEGQRLQERFALRLRCRFQAAAMAADWMALQRERSAEIVATVSETLSRAGEGVTSLVQFGGRLLAALVQLAVAFAIAPGPSSIALVVGVVLVPYQVSRLRRAFRRGRQVTHGGHMVQGIVTDHIAAIKVAKAHGSEAGLTDHFIRMLNSLSAQRLDFLRSRILARSGFRAAALVGLALVIWISVAELGTDGPALLVLVAVFVRLIPAVGEVLQHAHISAEALAAWTEAERLYVRLDAAAEPKAVANVPCPTGSIAFEQVSLAWPGRAKATLAGIDLMVAHRQTTAIIGPSGGGKSTIADLTLGLLVPTIGRIRVGNTDLQGAHRAAWHRQAAYVPQMDLLFHDSVRANLIWARPDAEEAALWRVLQTVALDETVKQLPYGLDTSLGDHGGRLSGGERQRLSLARALLRDPSFLVLDEATSHLDDANEGLIQTALTRIQHSVTMLVIAHRLQTVRHADHIIVIEAGRVTAQGTWDELVKQPESWLAKTLAGQAGRG